VSALEFSTIGDGQSDRHRELDAREGLLDAREEQLRTLEAALRRHAQELEALAEAVAAREAAVEQREQLAVEREAADRDRVQPRSGTSGSAAALDGMQEAFAREVARLERSDDFLNRSREAVRKAQSRLDALREAREHPPPG
jgi:hypothetical protein